MSSELKGVLVFIGLVLLSIAPFIEFTWQCEVCGKRHQGDVIDLLNPIERCQRK